MNYASIVGLAFTLLTAALSAWNAYQNARIGRVIAELQLNMRREYNGRYITLERFNDLKDRVDQLEDAT